MDNIAAISFYQVRCLHYTCSCLVHISEGKALIYHPRQNIEMFISYCLNIIIVIIIIVIIITIIIINNLFFVTV